MNDTVFNTFPASRVKQVHGNKVIQITEPLKDWVEADGIVTRTPNLPIGIITADCAPVLFYADGVVCAAHAGWQGALNGVLENTIAAMDCDVAFIQAFIGPCISQDSYEVSVGFEKPFLERDSEAERFFKPSFRPTANAGVEGSQMTDTRSLDYGFASTRDDEDQKLHFNLAAYCAYRLQQAGITNIDIDGRDTLTDPDFYSHRGGATTKERNLSAIMLDD